MIYCLSDIATTTTTTPERSFTGPGWRREPDMPFPLGEVSAKCVKSRFIYIVGGLTCHIKPYADFKGQGSL